jgi:hypothetical protein
LQNQWLAEKSYVRAIFGFQPDCSQIVVVLQPQKLLFLMVTCLNIDERLQAIAESLKLLAHDVRAVKATAQNLALSMRGLFAGSQCYMRGGFTPTTYASRGWKIPPVNVKGLPSPDASSF